MWPEAAYDSYTLELKIAIGFDWFTKKTDTTDIRDNVIGFLCSIKISVPQVRHIRDRKLKHCEARQFVKCLCLEVVKLKFFKAIPIITWPLGTAVAMGIHEIVEEILDSFPGILYLKMMNLETVFHQAIRFRRENVFNIIYQFEGAEHYLLSLPDASGNNCFHAAGRLVPQQKSNLRAHTAGAAMQVQKEVQWFKEVERLMQPADREKRNIEGKTPAMVFTETHEDLVKEAEKWMKDTAKSYTIVASLVLTVVFVAAIVIPGGNNSNNGLPRFYIEKAYDVFVISDALALFSSTSCVLIFLSILTSRYAENDFLYGLPNRMIAGLLTLFISIVSMMIASTIAIYLVFVDKTAWTLILAAGLACLPVTFFASLQFSLLFDMIKSTYFPGLFRKRTDLILY
ncbi:hypothetical protein RJ640_005785 [Escallonia rubra]|uniref:PGG domain-containing protein n=1 Tax=Escallonia rubra TaxID=112253 RepID=A0AA88R8E1_9ASTE|nr:hypothetical protein RJ640_005785 [Escallonia rubra]